MEAFEHFCQRLKSNKVTRWWEWRGCSGGEIEALERRYNVKLPATYRRYLSTMGRGAGRLFRHDHLAVTLEHVLDMTDTVRAKMVEQGAFSPFPPEALVILGRLDAYFEFIVCDSGDDSPVWAFEEGKWKPTPEPIHPSVLDWLQFWCDEAEYAIRTGYFDWLPGGTRP